MPVNDTPDDNQFRHSHSLKLLVVTFPVGVAIIILIILPSQLTILCLGRSLCGSFSSSIRNSHNLHFDHSAKPVNNAYMLDGYCADRFCRFVLSTGQRDEPGLESGLCYPSLQ